MQNRCIVIISYEVPDILQVNSHALCLLHKEDLTS